MVAMAIKMITPKRDRKISSEDKLPRIWTQPKNSKAELNTVAGDHFQQAGTEEMTSQVGTWAAE